MTPSYIKIIIGSVTFGIVAYSLSDRSESCDLFYRRIISTKSTKQCDWTCKHNSVTIRP